MTLPAFRVCKKPTNWLEMLMVLFVGHGGASLLIAGRWYHYRGRVLRRDGAGTLARQPGYHLMPLPPVAYAVMASLERQVETRCRPRRNAVFGPRP